jgi:hypothetical protein
MHTAFLGALSVAAALGLDAALTPQYSAAPLTAGPGSALTTRIAGQWTGERTTSLSTRPQRFTMIWNAAPTGRLTGMVRSPGQPMYAVNVVWSSDTAFIYESAPHFSHALHEHVVTRGVVHLKGKMLEGRLDTRPTKYEGRTITGTFTATRAS